MVSAFKKNSFHSHMRLPNVLTNRLSHKLSKSVQVEVSFFLGEKAADRHSYRHVKARRWQRDTFAVCFAEKASALENRV
jgi:hypothetical protein